MHSAGPILNVLFCPILNTQHHDKIVDEAIWNRAHESALKLLGCINHIRKIKLRTNPIFSLSLGAIWLDSLSCGALLLISFFCFLPRGGLMHPDAPMPMNPFLSLLPFSPHFFVRFAKFPESSVTCIPPGLSSMSYFAQFSTLSTMTKS